MNRPSSTPSQQAMLVVVHDRCVVDLSAFPLDHGPRYGRPSGPPEVFVHPGGWAVNLVEASLPKVFVNSARSSREHEIARSGPVEVTASGETFTISLTCTDKSIYRNSYERFVNPILWKLQHNLLSSGAFGEQERNAYERGYRQVNLETAHNVGRQLRRIPGPVTVSWQDYQWYLGPAVVRRWLDAAERDDVTMHHFVHIPFPTVDVWREHLPEDILCELLSGLLGNDVVGFHTAESADNFVCACSSVLGYAVDNVQGLVRLPSGRSTLIKPYPLPVSTGRLRGLAQSSGVRAAVADLRRRVGARKLIFRTERVDPSKDFLGSLQAYAKLLRETDVAGSVVYMARLLPSRESVPEWSDLRRRIAEEVCRVNDEFGRDGWDPVQIDFRDDLVRAIAGYILYDVLDVVPLADGMNQVSLEGPLLNRSDGVLVLSRGAGSYGLLGQYCLGVDPGNVAQHTAALNTALHLDMDTRRWRSDRLRLVASAGDPLRWLVEQVDDAWRVSRIDRNELQS